MAMIAIAAETIAAATGHAQQRVAYFYLEFVHTHAGGSSNTLLVTGLGDGQSFLIHVQHRTQDGRIVPHTTDELLISGLAVH